MAEEIKPEQTPTLRTRYSKVRSTVKRSIARSIGSKLEPGEMSRLRKAVFFSTEEQQKKIEEKEEKVKKVQAEREAETERADRAQEQAAIDSLTGLYNKRAFEDIGERTLQTAIRTKQPLALLYLDLDNLRDVNNTYGHIAGDVLLTKIGELIKTLTRKADITARIGGDEIAILLPGTSLEHAVIAAEKIRKGFQMRLLGSMSNYMPDREDPITVSVGCSTNAPGEEKSLLELKQEADDALYFSKGPVNGNGKNKVTVYSKDWVLPPHKSRITEPESR